MLTVLVTGPTVMQSSPFSSITVAVTIASTHSAYPQMDDQAELAWVVYCILRLLTFKDILKAF